MTLRPLAAILAALVLLAAPCALAQTPAAAPAPATTAAAPAPATEVAPATTEAAVPATTEAGRSGSGHRDRPRARRRPGPGPGSPRRHLPDDDHRHRPDRPPPPDRPRHPGDEEAGIGGRARRDRPGHEKETDQSTEERGEPRPGGESHGGSCARATRIGPAARSAGARADSSRCSSNTCASLIRRPARRTVRDPARARTLARGTHPRGSADRGRKGRGYPEQDISLRAGEERLSGPWGLVYILHSTRATAVGPLPG